MNKIARQAKNHNNKMRNVNHVYSYSFGRFLNQSDGNLLVNGGSKNKRRECLMSLIADTKNKSQETVVVFSEDRTLEEELINSANNGFIGRLFVCNEQYPNYDFFCGMSANRICEYFNLIAAEKGVRDTVELNSFTDAFLSILSSQSPIRLASMRYMARNDNTLLGEISQNPYDRDMILASSRGGVGFRSLLNNTCRAFSTLTTPSCETSLCLHNLLNRDCVVLINPSEFNPEFFSIYFAVELKSLIGQNFTCIFDDTVLLNNKFMQSVIGMMKQRQQTTIIISHENIVSIDSDAMLSRNFNRNLILLNGNTPYVDLQKTLSEFGQYTHMQPMANKSQPPKLIFTLYRGEGESAVPFTRDRVILQEEYGNEALLKGGSSSEIIIAKKLLP